MLTILTLTTIAFAGTTLWMWRRWLLLRADVADGRRDLLAAERRWEIARTEMRKARQQSVQAVKQHATCVRQLTAAKLEIEQLGHAFPSQVRRMFIMLDTSLSQLVKDLTDAGLSDEAKAQNEKRAAIQTILNVLISHRLDEDLLTVFSKQSAKVSERVTEHVN